MKTRKSNIQQMHVQLVQPPRQKTETAPPQLSVAAISDMDPIEVSRSTSDLAEIRILTEHNGKKIDEMNTKLDNLEKHVKSISDHADTSQNNEKLELLIKKTESMAAVIKAMVEYNIKSADELKKLLSL